MSDHIDQMILSLYILCNSYSQITKHIEEMYGMEFYKAVISAVTDKVILLLKIGNKDLLNINLSICMD